MSTLSESAGPVAAPTLQDAKGALSLLKAPSTASLGLLAMRFAALNTLAAFLDGLTEQEPLIVHREAFHMVYAEGGYGPTHKHRDCAGALHEAERLARTTGKTTYVLAATEKVVPTTTLAHTPLRVQPTNVTPFGPAVDATPNNAWNS